MGELGLGVKLSVTFSNKDSIFLIRELTEMHFGKTMKGDSGQREGRGKVGGLGEKSD